MGDEDDWEDLVVPTKVLKAKFKGETDEVVFDPIKGGEKPLPKKEIDPKSALTKPVALTKAQQKAREEEQARLAERARSSKPLTAKEKQEEQMRLRQAVEDADHELTDALFGVERKANAQAAKRLDGVQDVESLELLLSQVRINAGLDAKQFATAVAKRLESSGVKKDVQILFLKDLLRAACVALSDVDVNELAGVLAVIKNDKVKAKQGVKKKVVKPGLNIKGLDKEGGERYDREDDSYTQQQRYDDDNEDDDGFM